MNEMIEENKEDNTLYNLVRGGKSNLLVTKAVGEHEYRPQRPRMTVMMTTKPKGSNNGEDYRPRRDSSDTSSEGEDSSESDDSSSENEGEKQRGDLGSPASILGGKDVKKSTDDGRNESSCNSLRAL